MKFFYIVHDYYAFMSNFSFIFDKVNFDQQNFLYFSKSVNAADIKDTGSNVVLNNLLFNRKKVNIFELFFSSIQLFRQFLKNKNSIFTVVTLIPIMLSGFSLRILKRKCVFILTGLGSIFISKSFIYSLLRFFVHFCFKFFFKNKNSIIIVQNYDDRKYLIEKLNIEQSRVIVILGCGRSPDSFPYNEKLKDIGFPKIYVPARLIKDKGIEDIAAASHRLTEKGIYHEFIFTSGISRGNPKSYTEQEITQLKEDYPNLKFLGFQKDVRDVYNDCNIVCLPSYREGLPGVLLEASAMGIPIITTNTPGCREVVVHNETGLLVEPKKPEQIAQAVVELYNKKELSEKLRLSAHRRFLNIFALDKIIDEYSQFYKAYKL